MQTSLAFTPSVPSDIRTLQVMRSVAASRPFVAHAITMRERDRGVLPSRSYPIGPDVTYHPAQKRCWNVFGETWRASIVDDARALQCDAWASICEAVGQRADREMVLCDRGLAHRAWIIRRVESRGLWSLVATQIDALDDGEEVEIAVVLPPSADLLATLDGWGVDVDELHDVLDGPRIEDEADWMCGDIPW